MIRVDQVQPSVESLEEMTVHTSNFAAEYGQVAGGIFNLTAKSGTNTLRGSLFEYYVNEKLGAGIPFTNDGTGKLVKPAQPPQQLRWQHRRSGDDPGRVRRPQPDVLLLHARAVPAGRDARGVASDDAHRSDEERRLRRSAHGTSARRRSAWPADHGERDLRSAHDARGQRPGRARSVPRQRDPARAARPGGAEDSGLHSEGDAGRD